MGVSVCVGVCVYKCMHIHIHMHIHMGLSGDYPERLAVHAQSASQSYRQLDSLAANELTAYYGARLLRWTQNVADEGTSLTIYDPAIHGLNRRPFATVSGWDDGGIHATGMLLRHPMSVVACIVNRELASQSICLVTCWLLGKIQVMELLAKYWTRASLR